MSSEATSVMKEIKHVFTWTIKDFKCDKAPEGIRLPSVQFEFDLCSGMHFIGYLNLEGDTCATRILKFELKCTTNKSWNIRCIPEINIESKKEMIFSQYVSVNELSLLASSYDSYYRRYTNTCLLATVPFILKFTLSHVTYETALYPLFPMKEINHKHTFTKLFETKKFSDVSFQVAEKEICAHKCVLACASPVFGKMFEIRMKESLSNKVVIEDMDPDVFEEMLRFIYSEEVVNLKEMSVQLLSASDKYDLPTLKYICEKELAKNIAIENAAETFILADLYRAEELKKWAANFIKNNRKTVSKTAGWKELLKSHTEFVADLISELMI